MNLKELKETIDSTFERISKSHKNVEDIKVVITTKESSVGCRAFSNVKNVYVGFDWEGNQLRIDPEKDLVGLRASLNIAQNKMCKEFNGRKYYCCPKCGTKIAKEDRYCRKCSQKFKYV